MKFSFNSELFNTSKDLIELYQKNLSQTMPKSILAVCTPKNHSELKEIVSIAHENKIDLYVFSTGKNWGLGTKQPIVNNSVILDLRNLNRIIELNKEYRYVVIEPGVTQSQLSEFLIRNAPDLMFPVTGSAKGTSVMGNLLERGASAFNHRFERIVAMEVLLTDGKVLRTGHWHWFEEQNPLAFHYSKGFGPDLRGLFSQSNLGIVTKLVLRLKPKLEGTILIATFDEKLLSNTANKLRELNENKLLDDGLIVTYLNDPRITKVGDYNYKGKWFAATSFSGKSKVKKAKLSEIRRCLKDTGVDFIFLDSNKNKFSLKKGELIPFVVDFLSSKSFIFNKIKNKKLGPNDTFESVTHRFNMIRNFYNGVPTNYSIETMAAINGTLLDDDNLESTKMLGLVVALPAVPFNGKDMVKVSEIVNKVSNKFGVTAFHNFATIEELAFEGFFRIYFDRYNINDVEIAHSWAEMVNKNLSEAGYLPYRLDNARMQDFIDKDKQFWKVLADVKKVLDPNLILSKKKYNAV